MFRSFILIKFLVPVNLMFFTAFYSQVTRGQSFISPLDIPLSISSNFGELRTNQFHFGIDFKTLGKTGLNVYSIDSGYVSRIKTESGGYGRALYITHYNGYTSVYAHLLTYEKSIKTFCQNEQYKNKQSAIDVYLKPSVLKVKRGEIIALSGNAGYSSGPHLHFEIRDEKSQATLNVLKRFNFGIRDTIAPVIDRLWLYRINEDSTTIKQSRPREFQLLQNRNDYYLKDKVISIPYGKIAFGLETFDLINNSSNKTGTYEILLWIGDKLIFHQQIDQLSWDEMRYVNSLLDYGHYLKKSKKINRLFLQPNNQLSVYHGVVNRGVIDISDTIPHKVKIIVRDASLNESSLNFTIKGKEITVSKEGSSQKSKNPIMSYNRDNQFENDKIKLTIPQNALYDDIAFEYSRIPRKEGYLSEIHEIHNQFVPLQKAIKLSIKPVSVSPKVLNKLLIMNIDENGKKLWSGGEYKNGFVEALVRTFGRYVVAIDTIAPQIRLNGSAKNNDYSHQDQIQFIVTDKLSGIDTYNGFIDGQWALFEYDAKSDQISYEFDPTRIKFGIKHKLTLQVTDFKGNKSSFSTTFFK